MQAVDSEVMCVEDVGRLFKQLTIHHEQQTKSLVRQMAQYTETFAQKINDSVTQKINSLETRFKNVEDTMKVTNKALTVEKDRLTRKNATLAKQNDTQAKQNDQLTRANATLVKQNDQLTRTSATIVKEKDQLAKANVTLVKQNDALIEYANEFEEAWSDRMKEGLCKGVRREVKKKIRGKKHTDAISEVIENHNKK